MTKTTNRTYLDFTRTYIFILVLSLISHFTIAATGESCEDPFLITNDQVVDGVYTFSVNNSTSQFYSYTATAEGSIEMSSCLSGKDTYLKVYDACDNLIFEADNAGCFGGTEYIVKVGVGETYIFEWFPDSYQGSFDAKFYFKEPVAGESCDEPATLSLGDNSRDYWFGSQYFVYTSSASGMFEANTCGIQDDSFIKIFDACDGSLLADSWDYVCPNDPYGDYGQALVQYPMSSGESVILEVGLYGSYTEVDFDFNVLFSEEGNSCELPIAITEPGIYDVAHTHLEDNDQWYKFTAPKSGSVTINTKVPSMANGASLTSHSAQTYIQVYDECEGSLIDENDDYTDFYGASLVTLDLEEGEDYYIMMIDEFINEPYQFEIFYEEDLIIGTQGNPLEIELGLNEDFGHIFHVPEQWFRYEFPSDGVFDLRFTTYFSGIATEVTTENNIQQYYLDDDDPHPQGFKFAGENGDVLTFNLSNLNSTFTASFEGIGSNCEMPIDLTSEIIVDDRSTYNVDNTDGSQFFEVTVPTDGWLEMTTCTVGYQHNTYLKVYGSDCNLISETGMGCVNQASIDMKVLAGETYIFEWDPKELQVPHYLGINPYQYQAQMIFHETVSGQSCDDTKPIEEGSNAVDFWFDDQYFGYTAEQSGEVEISTCSYNGFDLYGFELLDACSGNQIGTTSYACDVYEQGVMSIKYDITKDESVVLRMIENYHERYDYPVDFSFTPTPGVTCENPIDLNEEYPIVGEGRQEIQVNNSKSSQFYTYTADQIGTIMMWSGYATSQGDPDFGTDLKVYKSTCDNLIADIDFSPGLLGGCSYVAEVEIGDTYIFEWSDHKWAGEFGAHFFFQSPQEGTECDEPLLLDEGLNTHNSMFSDQFFEYTAETAGRLEVSTCGINSAYYIYGLEILASCDGEALGKENEDCDPEDELDWFTIIYEMSIGETVLIKTPDRYYDWDYDFNAEFVRQGSACDNPISIANAGVVDVDYSNGDQWYSFVAPKDGDAVITTGISSVAKNMAKLHVATGTSFKWKNTKIEVYTACGDPLWLSNDDYYGLFDGASEINPNSGLTLAAGTDYLIKLIDTPNGFESEKGGQSPFEIFYTDDLIIGTSDVPLEVSLGLNEDYAHLYYAEEQWFRYEFAEAGEFNMLLTRYYDGAGTTISSEKNIQFTYPDDDSGPDGFYYQGEKGEVLTFKLSNKNRNNTFTASLDACIPDNIDVSKTVCLGYEFNDQLLTTSGDYSATFTNQAGCDSLVNLALIVHPKYDEVVEISSCESYEFDGNVLSASGDYTATFQSVNNCDSLVNLSLTILASDEETISKSACYSYTFDETELFESGDYLATFTNQAGCDSLVNLALIVYPTYDEVVEISSCESYEFGGNVLSASGDYSASFQSVNSCDSLVNLSLTILESDEETISRSACHSYTFDDIELFESGEYSATFTNQAGCDSLVNLALTVYPKYDEVVEISSCESYEFDGNTLSASGDYSATFQSVNSCDSLVNLSLTILESDEEKISRSACHSYTFDGTELFESGDYLATFTNQAGCDSLVSLSLTVHPKYDEVAEISSCESYEFDGNILNASGDYTATFQSVNSCDSLVNLSLTILENDKVSVSREACHSYAFDETELFESGNYSATFTNQAGCDSLVNLALTVYPKYDEVVEISSCESYEFNGNVLSASGDYLATFQSVNSCDSLVNLSLTILENDEVSVSKEVCGSYIFSDKELSSSGDYTMNFTNQSGCDSLVHLSLTVFEEPSAATTIQGKVVFAAQRGGVTYQWIDCQTNEPLDGETQRQLTPHGTGIYAVEVSNANCLVVSECINVDVILGIEHHANNELKIYPNPAVTYLDIELTTTLDDVTIELRNLAGQLESKARYKNKKRIRIDVEGLNSGIHLIRITAPNGYFQYSKFIKS